ncbi:wax ester/triacylglycerol synthase family O-acyltransferase [Actinosynnema sp. NPDC047251]|uniref:Diacylglycerol O-acyltransferase n=1 Tax=Saccharothrix espanaensis (strain ATCC 51144 / DSM 44229 / JCM 9112 / NBRC 15066 / NRRL 15764) TaxID=1179773 RepID=K0JYV1_SACES|nr:wax ester/triacylglycerol synthase family O-acyltransferase [Saccharothrix espanaensis]CCH29879.1 Acyltransferase, WS/DGAT/MGAT [Saccharothrix espanaensis DSM 44229]
MDRMNAMDAGFFFIEDENVPMHVGSVLVFEGPAPTYGDVVRLFAAKLGTVPRYRQRVRSLPLHLGRPVWVDDEHFQILYHVRHTAVPVPGADDQLRNLAGRLFAQRLDLAKPLWEVWLVEGLEDGRWAIISKVHHCMVDGIAGTDLMRVLLDRRADAELPAPTSWTPDPSPSTLDLVVDGVRDAVLTPVKHLAAVPVPARRLRSASEVVDVGRAVLGSLPDTARRLAVGTPKSLNGRIGPHRRWLWARAGLPEVKQIRKVTGGTVNDIILAAVTRAFRDLLTKRDELVDGLVVRTMVPVSVRSPAEKGLLTNRVSAILVNLPVAEPDPLVRLASVREQMDDLKGSRQAAGADVLTSLGDFAAPALLALGSRTAMRFPQQLLQTVTTNVPGPRIPLYVLGRKLTEIYPYVPIAAKVRISIGIFSYLDRITFGVTADFDGVPDAHVLADGIRAGFDELTAATAG